MEPKPPARPPAARRPRKASPEDSPLARTVLLQDEAAAQFVAEQVSQAQAEAPAPPVPAEKPLAATVALDGEAAERAAAAPALPFEARERPPTMSSASAIAPGAGSGGDTLMLGGEAAEPLWVGRPIAPFPIEAPVPPLLPTSSLSGPPLPLGAQFLAAMAELASAGDAVRE